MVTSMSLRAALIALLLVPSVGQASRQGRKSPTDSLARFYDNYKVLIGATLGLAGGALFARSYAYNSNKMPAERIASMIGAGAVGAVGLGWAAWNNVLSSTLSGAGLMAASTILDKTQGTGVRFLPIAGGVAGALLHKFNVLNTGLVFGAAAGCYAGHKAGHTGYGMLAGGLSGAIVNAFHNANLKHRPKVQPQEQID